MVTRTMAANVFLPVIGVVLHWSSNSSPQALLAAAGSMALHWLCTRFRSSRLFRISAVFTAASQVLEGQILVASSTMGFSLDPLGSTWNVASRIMLEAG